MYTPMGAIAAGVWCSDKSPVPGCKTLAGVCKPMTAATLETFKALQREVNRTLGKTAVNVDGRIGSATLAATKDAVRKVGLSVLSLVLAFTHCDQLATSADFVAQRLRAYNDAKSRAAVAEAKPSLLPTAPPSMPGPGGTVAHPEDSFWDKLTGGQGLSLATLATPLGIAAIGVVGVLLWRKRQAPRANPRRRRRRR